MDKTIIIIDDIIYNVEVYSEDTELKQGYAYIFEDNNAVYPFRGDYSSKKTKIGVYWDKESKILKVISPDNEEEMEKYDISNIVEMEPKNFVNIKKRATDEIVSSGVGDTFAPEINEGDNFLKVIVKTVLKQKPVNFKEMAKFFNTPHTLTNLKSTLKNDTTKMSVDYFSKWCEMLGIELEITVKAVSDDFDSFEIKV